MMRWTILVLGLSVLAPASARGQSEFRRSEGIGLRARVIEALSTSTGAETIGRLQRVVPSLVSGQASVEGSFRLEDMDRMLDSLDDLVPEQPGVVVSVVVVGPDGAAVRGVAGRSSIPGWLVGPAISGDGAGQGARMAFGDVLRRDEGEYYLYVNISACDV